MWRLAFSLSAALVVQAIQLEDGVHDHHNQALVLEGWKASCIIISLLTLII